MAVSMLAMLKIKVQINIGVDQGIIHLIKQNIKPIIAIGDMDSIEDKDLLKTLKVDEYSCIKDDTDTALALRYAFQQGYDVIDLYGVTQKRMDHFFSCFMFA